MEKTCQTWRKSTYSNATSANCVEVSGSAGQVLVRDTKDHEAGPVVGIPARAWGVFTATLK